jgi:hypothetical protein
VAVAEVRIHPSIKAGYMRYALRLGREPAQPQRDGENVIQIKRNMLPCLVLNYRLEEEDIEISGII